MFHTDDDYEQSVDRARRDMIQARLTAGADPLTGYLLPRVAPPIPPRRKPLDTIVACHDALDEVIETFGMSTVLRCLVLTCAANDIKIEGSTIEDIAAGEERQ
jgi:hypothetical protein